MDFCIRKKYIYIYIYIYICFKRKFFISSFFILWALVSSSNIQMESLCYLTPQMSRDGIGEMFHSHVDVAFND